MRKQDGRFNEYPSRNLLINGGFDVWQRGTSFTVGTGTVYYADRWQSRPTTNTGGTTTISKVSDINYGNGLKLQVAGHTGVDYITQKIEFPQQFHNKKLTLSMKTKFSHPVDFTAQAYIKHASGTVDFSVVPLVRNGDTLSCLIPENDLSGYAFDENSYFGIQIESIAALPDGSYEFYQVQLEKGSVATEFERLPLTLIELLCHRYYQTASPVYLYYAHSTSNNTKGVLNFPVKMHAKPTLDCTLSPANGTWTNDTSTEVAAFQCVPPGKDYSVQAIHIKLDAEL